jgi:hypothetical protein
MSVAPQISVVMSVYNNAGTLSAALGSVLSQEGVGLECISLKSRSVRQRTDAIRALM